MCANALVCVMWDGSLLVYKVSDNSAIGFAIETYTPSRSKIVRAFSGGKDTIILLLEDGSILARGDNRDGQLSAIGGEKVVEWTAAFAVHQSNNIKMIVFGSMHIVVLDKDGSAYGYGENSEGQLDIFKHSSPLTNVQKVQCKCSVQTCIILY